MNRAFKPGQSVAVIVRSQLLIGTVSKEEENAGGKNLEPCVRVKLDNGESVLEYRNRVARIDKDIHHEIRIAEYIGNKKERQ